MTRPPQVLITSRSFGSGQRDWVAALQEAGCAVERGPADHDLAALRPALARCTAWIAGTGPVRDAHLAAAPDLRIVARYGVGVDAVDLAAARERGVLVTNTPGANSESVADHALALALALVRAVPAGDLDVRAGHWTPRASREIGAMTVGILGFGRIGRAAARRFAGFGARVRACDPFVPADQIRAAGAEPSTPEDLPRSCDLISLHAPGGATVVTAEWLAAITSGAFLVNTARADLVDEHALADALHTGGIAGYAADTISAETTHEVWPSTAVTPPADGACPLLDPALADRVVLTPHRAAQSVEAVERMGQGATTAVLDVLAGRTPTHTVT